MINPFRTRKRKHVAEVCNAPDKKIDEAENTLARVFRRVLLENAVNESIFMDRLEKWLNVKCPVGDHRRSTMSGNISKALMDTEMTWKVLMEGIRILKPMAFSITFTFHWPNGKVNSITEYFSDDTVKPFQLEEPDT